MKLLLLFLLLFNFGIFCHGRYEPRIVNGSPVPLGKYMNVVRIMGIVDLFDMKFNASEPGNINKVPSLTLSICTGTIISDRHILTAAHCVYNGRNQTIITDLPGFLLDYRPIDENLQKGAAVTLNISKQALVTTFYPHKNFHWQNFQDDVAIIEFPDGTQLGDPVKLAKNYEEGINDMGVSTGYGDTAPGPDAQSHPTTLIELNVPIFKKKDCIMNNKTHPIICVGNSTHRADKGDSGGPLFFKKEGQLYQIGIAHDGANFDGTPNEKDPKYTVYMRLSAYCEWIEKTTKGKAKCEDIPPSSGAPATPESPAPESPATPESPADPTPAPQTGSGNGNDAILKNTFIILFAILIANVLNFA